MGKIKKTIGHISEIQNSSFRFLGALDIEKSLKDHIIPSQTTLLAVSGGPDSIFAAYLVYKFFIQQKWDLQKLIFVHCNHSTRAGNKKEAEFLQRFFSGLKLIIVTRTSKWGKHNEESLRKRRYQEFQKLATKYSAQALILWHNLTDRIESTFLHLLRGANLKWFLSMSEYEEHPLLKNCSVFRPLLHLSKAEILKLCSQLGLPFVVDPTNQDSTTSLRNKLRNTVLPSLYALAHKADAGQNTFQQSMENIYKAIAELATRGEKWYHLQAIPHCSLRHSTFAYEIILKWIQRTDEVMMQLLQELHLRSNVSSSLIHELTKFFSTAEQWYKYVQWTYFFLAHGRCYIIQAPANFREKTVEKSKEISTLWAVKRYNFSLTIDDKKLLPASLRFAKSSDRYHGKTRNQYCITAKIPLFRRGFIPVLVKNWRIIKIWKEII